MNYARNSNLDKELLERVADMIYDKFIKKQNGSLGEEAVFNLLVRGMTSTYQIAEL
jgi:hypothetical protein